MTTAAIEPAAVDALFARSLRFCGVVWKGQLELSAAASIQLPLAIQLVGQNLDDPKAQ